MKDIIVINRRAGKIPNEYKSVYITRPFKLGNPFFMKSEADRDKVIAMFKNHLWNEMQNPDSEILAELRKLAESNDDIALVCCCKPAPCHGDVIKAAILWMRGQNN